MLQKFMGTPWKRKCLPISAHGLESQKWIVRVEELVLRPKDFAVELCELHLTQVCTLQPCTKCPLPAGGHDMWGCNFPLSSLWKAPNLCASRSPCDRAKAQSSRMLGWNTANTLSWSNTHGDKLTVTRQSWWVASPPAPGNVTEQSATSPQPYCNLLPSCSWRRLSHLFFPWHSFFCTCISWLKKRQYGSPLWKNVIHKAHSL